jgi:hypothetical protein
MKSSRKQKASSLVTTLLVLVVLSTIVIAFLQSMSIERMTARSLSNKVASELASRGAVSQISQLILTASTNDDFIVVRNGNFDFIGLASSGTGTNSTVQYMPLFSVATNGTQNSPKLTNMVGVLPEAADFLTSGDFATFKGCSPSGGDVQVSWIYSANSQNEITSRYAYYATDLHSRIDAKVSGNNTPSTPHQRSSNSPNDLALYSIFDPQNTNGIEQASEAIIKMRPALLTAASMNQVVSNNLVTNLLNVTFGLRSDSERDLIPLGMNYTDEGLPKTNINSFVTSKDYNGLANYISRQLPLFAQTNRAGGTSDPETYLKNLAANIIDYADIDTDPVSDGATVRGVDSYPWITTHYIQFHWRRVDSSGQPNPSSTPLTPDQSAANFWYAKNGTWHARVDVTSYVQAWNLSSKPITNGVLSIQDLYNPDGANSDSKLLNKYSVYAAGNETPVAYEGMPAILNPGKEVNFSTNTLPANGFQIFGFAPNSYECDTGIATSFPRPNLSSGSPMRFGERNQSSVTDHSTGLYRILWNGLLVDQPGNLFGNRIERRSGTLDRETSGDGPGWRGIVIGLRYDRGFPNPPGESVFNLGDPRGNFYIRKELAANDYDGNSSWGGRHYATNLLHPTSGTAWIGAETLVSAWPDGGHNTTPGDSVYRLNPNTGSVAQRDRNQRLPSDPNLIAAPLEINKAPTRISDAGSYTNILELGNVYDPVQWRPDWVSKNSSDPLEPADRNSMTNSWQTLHKIGLVPDNRYVVPGSLRIGRAEHLQFNSNGLRSAQFLDIFATDDDPRILTQGLLNINTASVDAIRALIAGIQLTSDPLVTFANGTNAPQLGFPEVDATNGSIGTLFAETVISNRPFLSRSALGWITNANGGFFGNADQYPTTKTRPALWNDSVREELFGRIFPLVTVRSRCFQVNVIGQTLDKRSGKVLARTEGQYWIFLKPTRNANGTITKQSMEIFYALVK